MFGDPSRSIRACRAAVGEDAPEIAVDGMLLAFGVRKFLVCRWMVGAQGAQPPGTLSERRPKFFGSFLCS